MNLIEIAYSFSATTLITLMIHNNGLIEYIFAFNVYKNTNKSSNQIDIGSGSYLGAPSSKLHLM